MVRVAIAALVIAGCSPRPFITLRVEDPQNFAAAATRIEIALDDQDTQIQSLSTGFPADVVISGGDRGTESEIQIRVVDEAGRRVAEQTLMARFDVTEPNIVTTELARACADVSECPDDGRIFRCSAGFCTSTQCGDGNIDDEEECDDGPDNSDTEPGACRSDCRRFCAGTADCANGLVCNAASLCEVPVGMGGQCEIGSECGEGLKCENEVCCAEGPAPCCEDSDACFSGLKCQADTFQCLIDCVEGDDEACVDPEQVCNADGVCVEKRDIGAECITAGQCLSGHCADGRCCDRSCDGVCEACREGLTGQAEGSCAPVFRSATDSGTCTSGGTGCAGERCVCDGHGVCASFDGATCSASSECLAGVCDGVCRPGELDEPCDENFDCGAGLVCIRNACSIVARLGEPCEEAEDCGGANVACDADACACSVGFANCDGSVATGCEQDLAAPSHCGACDRRCGFGASCAAGLCLCVADAIEECLDADARSCNAEGECISGSVVGFSCRDQENNLAPCVGAFVNCGDELGCQCNVNRGDCDNDPVTGCEEDLRNNDRHCGSCGNDCGTGRCAFDVCE